jgi:hypothetical protein
VQIKFKLRQERHRRNMSLLTELVIFGGQFYKYAAPPAWFGVTSPRKDLKAAKPPPGPPWKNSF